MTFKCVTVTINWRVWGDDQVTGEIRTTAKSIGASLAAGIVCDKKRVWILYNLRQWKNKVLEVDMIKT